MVDKWESEKELGKAVVDHYRSLGWTVYPELNDIDIVIVKDDLTCKNGKRIYGIECKKHFNLTVLAQADHKRKYVDAVYVAVSRGWKNNESFGCAIAKKFGIGVIYVDKHTKYIPVEDYKWDNSKPYQENYKLCQYPSYSYTVEECREPEITIRKDAYIDDLLSPHAENFAEAGQKGGKHWTMFKKTGMALVEYVQNNPGTTMKEVVQNIDHHYSSNSSAKGCLARGIREGLIQGVKYEGRVLVPTSFSS